MNFEIGHNVKFYKDLTKQYVVLATRNQDLNTDFLNSKVEKFTIKNLEKLAESNLSVLVGFHYKIGEIIGYEDGLCIIGNFENAFEDDLQF